MPPWQTNLLIVSAIIVPLVWGYAVSSLLDRFWPVAKTVSDETGPAAASLPHDYHI